MAKQIIFTENAPKSIGPYSQAVKCGDFLFISGQLPNNLKTGAIIGGDVSTQTEQALKNVLLIAVAGGMSKQDIVKVTVFLADIGNYSAFNSAYERFFEGHFPARECIGVSGLPKNVLVGISAICGK